MLSDLAAPLFPPHPPEVSDTDSWPPETSPAADCLQARPGRRSSESRLSTGAARYSGEAGEAGAGGEERGSEFTQVCSSLFKVFGNLGRLAKSK